jgi:uncharacterized membrane protein
MQKSQYDAFPWLMDRSVPCKGQVWESYVMTEPVGDSKVISYFDRFAAFFGSIKFIAGMSVFVVAWFMWNIFAPEDMRFDKYPFIFMTLLLSLQASYAAPIILFSQNRQSDKDRLKFEMDLESDLKSEKMLEKISAKLGIEVEDDA